MVKRSVGSILGEWCIRDDLEDTGQDFEILKQMPTKLGIVNWLIGVGKNFTDYLINCK